MAHMRAKREGQQDLLFEQKEANNLFQTPQSSLGTKEQTKHSPFPQDWHRGKVLGEGGDGIVYLYQQKHSNAQIAVKVPRRNSVSSRKAIAQEVKNLRLIGLHDHILGLYDITEDFQPHEPAIRFSVCDLGDLITYRNAWCAQQSLESKAARVSELTMWKLFRDMVLALNYIHHELDVCDETGVRSIRGVHYVHGDFKPGNILVVTPPDVVDCQKLPEEPTFKLSDFARLTRWPTPKDRRAQDFCGTPEYAPPVQEQIAPVITAVDIWGLGGTLQYMALGNHPTQSRSAFVRSRRMQGKTYPELANEEEWQSEYWRIRVPTVYRPIDVSIGTLCRAYDLQELIPDWQPYGMRLSHWYTQLWEPVATRPKASKLVVRAVPEMDECIEEIKVKRRKEAL